MAAGILQKPGTKLGACKTKCKHKDCASLREIEASPCGICDEAIGCLRRYYSRESGGYVHADCFEDFIEQHGHE